MIALVLNHLWQSTAFSAVAGVLTLLMRNNSANVRFSLWFAASLKFLIPFSLLAMLGTAFAPAQMNPAATSMIVQAKPAVEPFTSVTAHFEGSSTASLGSSTSIGIDDVLLGVWLVGAGLFLALWVAKYIKLRSIAHAAIPLALPTPIPVRSSNALMEPGLVGIWHPVLLLPKDITQRLSSVELDAIIAHEMCHARRRDNLTAAVHMLVQAVFWFYPLTWWIGRRLVAEREQACDQAVVALGNDPDVYAESILKVCKLYLHSPLDCAAGIAGADLRRRIEAIMENRFIKKLGGAKKAVLAAVAVLAIGVPVAGAMVMPGDTFGEARASASAGTEAALRHLIESWQRHQPDFAALSPAMAQIFRQHEVGTQQEIDRSGPVKSITFQRVSSEGWDVYSVAFANALSTWNVAPLTADGRIPTLGYWPAYARHDGTRPSPGTEAALRHQIEGWERDQPAYDSMSLVFGANMKQQYAAARKFFEGLGALESISFDHVDANGWDMYNGVFGNGRVVFSIPPLTADGKVNGLKVSPAFAHPGAGPSPGTEASLRRTIAALEQGSPDYNTMTPAMAAIIRFDWADMQTQFKTWGKLRALKFRVVDANGLNVFDATFEHGHGVWQIAPLTKDGKLLWLIYDAF